MTLKQIPWALTDGGAAANPAERVRQAHQSHLGSTGVESTAALQVTALGTPNMSVNVAPGGVWIPGTLGSTTAQAINNTAQTTYGAPATFTSQGSYYDYNDATVNLTISAANATNPRIDLIVATVQDADYAGGSNQAILQVITGTAAASPVAPTPPASSLVLAQIAVAANATSITSGNITDTRPIAGTGGPWSAWTPSPTATFITVTTVSARYKQLGKNVYFEAAFSPSGNWNSAASLLSFNLPVAPQSNYWCAAGIQLQGGTNYYSTSGPTAGGYSGNTGAADVSGVANNRTLVFSGTYEAA